MNEPKPLPRFEKIPVGDNWAALSENLAVRLMNREQEWREAVEWLKNKVSEQLGHSGVTSRDNINEWVNEAFGKARGGMI